MKSELISANQPNTQQKDFLDELVLVFFWNVKTDYFGKDELNISIFDLYNRLSSAESIKNKLSQTDILSQELYYFKQELEYRTIIDSMLQLESIYEKCFRK